ncbi:MAG TPA: hypothetical protein ENJ42_05465 [Hellea balneolensis]|uniref:Uncharacterized protein n=1 Tax=Hellea balneolensis TaxID=287478 RepID=A0A7C5R491_9PROT|nr:hypothetical protein [Hellea balneolensis]
MTDIARATTAPAIDMRLKIAAVWSSLLFIFADVDMVAFFRADVLQDALAGKVAVFTVDQSFLLLTTLYVIIPSLMISLSLILPPRANRLTNIIVAAVYALTILGSCIGEVWIYYWVGSLTEVLLLLVILRYAWKMP